MRRAQNFQEWVGLVTELRSHTLLGERVFHPFSRVLLPWAHDYRVDETECVFEQSCVQKTTDECGIHIVEPNVEYGISSNS